MYKAIKKIHFVGIGGSGMSGIAEILLDLGYNVSGSDVKRSDVTDHLKKLGAKINIGHKKENVRGAHVVVQSTAIKGENPEIQQALKHKITVIPRVEMLAEIARLKYTVTIAGTHGKTTTTSLCALILESGGFDPTVVIGGRLNNIKSGAKAGKGKFLVAEADESDGSFLKLSPSITVVTNIDNDHLDFYGNIENIKQAFIKHLNSVPFYGCSIICVDDKNINKILKHIKRRYYTYGLNSKADFTAKNIKVIDYGFSFDVIFKGKNLGRVKLSLPGRHNILNALSAIAVGVELGIKFSDIKEALGKFAGVARRLEIKGFKKGVMVIDDYGHHPTEISATISAIKANWPNSRLIAIFQPHRYSRTAHLYSEFGKCFAGADKVILMDIYPAGEKPISGINSKLVYDSMKKNKVNVDYYKDLKILSKQLNDKDIVLTLGAGDVWKTGEELLKKI